MGSARRRRRAAGRPSLAGAALAVLLLAIPAAATVPPGQAPGGAQEDPREARREGREALKAGDHDAPTVAWREGPVRYILTAEEDQEFRRLRSREDRARFIQRFWAGRDPDPSTPANEYRDLFEERVDAASRLFTAESTKPGWKTDRGKIFILLGPPDDFDEATFRQRAAAVITWTYRDPPPGTAAAPNTQVRFVRDASGEYRLTTGLRLFASESAMSAALALQALQVRSQPETRRILDSVASADAGAGGAEAPLASRAEVFRAAPGLALVLLTLWVPESLVPEAAAGEPPPIEVAARLVSADGAGRSYDLEGSGALRAGPGDGGASHGNRRLFQGGALVRPGRYTVYYALVPEGGTNVRSFRDEIDVHVPDGDILSVGPIGLAARLERLPERAATDYAAPFVLGHLRIVPRLEPVLGQHDELAFYYQAIGAAADPIEGLPDMDVEYQVLLDDPASGAATAGPRPFGRPIHLIHEQEIVQGFSLPISGWPPGAYVLRVTVTDNLTGATASRDARFRVR